MIATVLPVEAPYRLDLTVAVLRRFSTNVVDVMLPGGRYYRVLSGSGGAPVVGCVRQVAADALDVRLWCEPDDAAAATASLRRMLGTERRTPLFESGARAIPWLRGLAERMRGVRPPRYPTLWEACVNAIVFQQVSLHAASAILRRTIVALEEPVRAPEAGVDVDVRPFPGAATVLAAPDATLRAAGLSAAKIATLRRVAEMLALGELDEAAFARRSSAQAAAALCAIKGIGPWTATVILLRGLGRLDVFPPNDSGVARGFAALTDGSVDLAAALEVLGDERGMLYFHLLLARLEARGELHLDSDFVTTSVASRSEG